MSDEKLYKLLFDVIGESEERDPKTIKLISNYISNNLVALAVQEGAHVVDRVSHVELAKLIGLTAAGEISSNATVELIGYLVQGGVAVLEEAQSRGLMQQNDEGALQELVDVILGDNTDAVAEFRSGKEQALQFLVGQGMKASKGTANPAKIKEMLLKSIS